jgi:hypothetical protein
MYQNGLNSGNIIGVVTYLTNELMKW